MRLSARQSEERRLLSAEELETEDRINATSKWSKFSNKVRRSPMHMSKVLNN